MAANFLLTAEKTSIQWVLDYLTRGNGAGVLDEKAADELSKNHATFGYNSEIKMREELRDRPIVTLLTVILYFNSRT